MFPAVAVAPHCSASTIPTPAYLPGTLIAGKYRLVSRLGEGGMGSVWSAKNTVLDLDVALKLIRREMAGPEMGTRLLREARATALLGHRSIVRVFDFGTTEQGDPFLVMEILEGVSLATLLDREARMQEDEAVRTLLPVADALAAAHARGILHCDVKPDNVVLVPDGPACAVPKLVDFGIAKFKAPEHGLLAGPASRPGERIDAAYTRFESGVSLIPRDELTGARLARIEPTVAGTPDYMSPEQAQGHELDERTDIWSLGVLLYEAVTGVRPFYDDDVHEQLRAICTDTPRPASDYRVDPSLSLILQRAMEKDPAARWPTMTAFGSALAAWALALGVETDVTGTSLAERWGQTAPHADHAAARRAAVTAAVAGSRREHAAARHATASCCARAGDDAPGPANRQARGPGARGERRRDGRALVPGRRSCADRGARRRGGAGKGGGRSVGGRWRWSWRSPLPTSG